MNLLKQHSDKCSTCRKKSSILAKGLHNVSKTYYKHNGWLDMKLCCFFPYITLTTHIDACDINNFCIWHWSVVEWWLIIVSKTSRNTIFFKIFFFLKIKFDYTWWQHRQKCANFTFFVPCAVCVARTERIRRLRSWQEINELISKVFFSQSIESNKTIGFSIKVLIYYYQFHYNFAEYLCVNVRRCKSTKCRLRYVFCEFDNWNNYSLW